MISVEKAVIARLESHGKRFEALVDPQKALDFKSGKDIEIDDLFAAMEVFTDSQKGERANGEDLKEVFGTDDVKKALLDIVKKGRVQLTTDQRKEMREKKRREIIDIISRQSINPQTNTPHPPQRIENAINEAKVQIKEDVDAASQVDTIVNALKTILPIRVENVRVQIRIPAQHAAKAYGKLKSITTLEKEEWLGDGTLSCVIKIPAGIQNEVYSTLNSATGGTVETKIIKKND